MNAFPSTLPAQQHLFAGILQAATAHAAAAMSRWTHGQVQLSLEDVRESPLEEALEVFDLGYDLLTMINLDVQGDYGGRLVLSFDDENGRLLAYTLLGGRSGGGNEWSELDRSAVMETANIFASAYLSELAQRLGVRLTPSAPLLTQDYGASVLEQALMCQALTSNTVLSCRTRFELNNQQLNWSVFFVPDQALLGAMVAASS